MVSPSSPPIIHHVNLQTEALNIIDKEGNTWLHSVCAQGDDDALAKMLELNPSLNIDVKNQKGETPLMRAVEAGREKIVRLLMTRLILVDEADAEGNTALHRTAKQTSTLVFANLLLEKGANVNKPNHYGQTPLHFAAGEKNTSLVALLLSQGASVHACSNNGDTPLICAANAAEEAIIRALLQNQANPHHINNQKYNVLHFTALRGYVVATEQFLNLGVSPNVQNQNGDTPLHLVAIGNSTSKENYQRITQLLLVRQANPNSCNYECETPLHKACHKVDSVVVNMLLNAGAIHNTRSKKGTVFYHLAMGCQHGAEISELKAILQALKAKGAKIDTESYSLLSRNTSVGPFIQAELKALRSGGCTIV